MYCISTFFRTVYSKLLINTSLNNAIFLFNVILYLRRYDQLTQYFKFNANVQLMTSCTPTPLLVGAHLFTLRLKLTCAVRGAFLSSTLCF